MNKDLTKALSLEEIMSTILAMPKGKMSGKDGIPKKIVQENLKQMVSTLLKTYNAMLDLGSTSAFMNKDLIVLIPKRSI